MSKWTTRLLAVLTSTAVGLSAAFLWWNQREEPETVVLVDNREERARLLDERQEAEAPTPREERGLEEWELLYGPIPEADARVLFASLARSPRRMVYDPDSFYWEAPDTSSRLKFEEAGEDQLRIHTNSWGFRKQEQVLSIQPDLRIIAAGDSHTAGVGLQENMFANRLESMLKVEFPNSTIEGLNGGKGGFNFYNYVGTLEKCLPLDPDVFVVTVYGGNDFGGAMAVYRYFNQLPAAPTAPRSQRSAWLDALRPIKGLVSQDFNQVMYFAANPDDEAFAEKVARQSTLTIQRICEQQDIELIYVYIPPIRCSQPWVIGASLEEAISTAGFTEAELGITERLALALEQEVREADLPWIDMTPIYKESSEPCYWVADLHINDLGNRLIAEQLFEHLSPGLRD